MNVFPWRQLELAGGGGGGGGCRFDSGIFLFDIGTLMWLSSYTDVTFQHVIVIRTMYSGK